MKTKIEIKDYRIAVLDNNIDEKGNSPVILENISVKEYHEYLENSPGVYPVAEFVTDNCITIYVDTFKN